MGADLVKKFFFFILSTGLQAITNYFVLSFFSHELNIENFGKYNIYISIIPLLLTFCILGIDGAINVYYHKFNKRNYKVLLFNSFFIILPLIGFFSFVIYIPILDFISKIFKLDFITSIILLFISIFQSFILSYLSYLQTKGEAYRYLKIFSSHIILSNTIGIINFYLYKTLFSYFMGILIINLIYTFYILYTLWKTKLLIAIPDLSLIKLVLKYGISLLPNALGSYIFFMSDRYFISYFYGNKEVAYYSVGLYISMIIIMFNHALVKAWNPILFKKLKNLNNKNKFKLVEISYLIMFAYILLYILILLFDNTIFNIIFPNRLVEGLKYVPWIALGYTFIGFFKVFSGYLFYVEKNKLISTISLLSAIINIILNYTFIKIFGPIGVAYATASTMFIFMVFVFIYVQKFFKLPWIDIRWIKVFILKK